MKTKQYSFFWHYNKPASRAAGRNILSVHYRQKCHLVYDVECNVPLKTKTRKTQPHCVLVGKGVLRVVDNVAIINKE